MGLGHGLARVRTQTGSGLLEHRVDGPASEAGDGVEPTECGDLDIVLLAVVEHGLRGLEQVRVVLDLSGDGEMGSADTQRGCRPG